MKKRSLIYMLIIVVLTTVSCGPRRYKCGPYRKCENSIEKTEKSYFNNEFYKNNYC